MQRTPPKEMHVALLPFLEKNTSLFMKVRGAQMAAGGPLVDPLHAAWAAWQACESVVSNVPRCLFAGGERHQHPPTQPASCQCYIICGHGMRKWTSSVWPTNQLFTHHFRKGNCLRRSLPPNHRVQLVHGICHRGMCYFAVTLLQLNLLLFCCNLTSCSKIVAI